MEEPEAIFENKDFIIVNKPSGLLVHGVRLGVRRLRDEETASEPTLVGWLLARYPEIKNVGDDPALRPGIVHRLDKATSGVMIVARTQASFGRLKELFQSHQMKKTYFAVVQGVPKEKRGVIDAPIGIKSGSLKRSIHSSKMAKPAVTEYEVIESAGGRSLLKIRPKTGRTHQIRVHLASIGHPIIGDVLYGRNGKSTEMATRLMLHAGTLAFEDGDGSRFEFEAPLPGEFRLSTGPRS